MTTFIKKKYITFSLYQALFLIGATIYTILVAFESTRLPFLSSIFAVFVLTTFFMKREWIIPAIFASFFIPFSISVVGVVLRPADFLLGLAFIILLLDYSLNGGQNFKAFPYHKTIILFILATLLSLLKARHVWDSISDIVQVIEFYIIGGLVFANYLNEKILKQVSVICISGILAQDIFVIPAFIKAERFWGWTGSAFPYIGIFAALLTYHGIIYFKGKRRLMSVMAFIMIWLGLLASCTRSAWLSTLTGILLANFVQSRALFWKSIAVVIIIVMLLIIFSPVVIRERIQSIVDFHYFSNVSRFFLIYSAWNAFIENPLTGVGIKNFHQQLPDFLPLAARYLPEERKQTIAQEIIDGAGAHNMYLEILGELGALGFIAIIYLMFMSLRDSRRNLKNSFSIYKKIRNSCVYACLIAFYMMAFFVPGIHVRIEFTIFWIFLLASITNESHRKKMLTTE